MHGSSFAARAIAAGLWALAWCCCAGKAAAQQPPWLPSSDAHSWARFGRGAWKTVRVQTESFDEQGNTVLTTTTDNRIELQRATRYSISLCITGTWEVAGSELAADPKTITQQWDDAPGRVERLDNEAIRIGERDYPTQVVRIAGSDGKAKRTSTVYYRTTGVPQVLKRVMLLKDPMTGDVLSETTVAVTELDEQREILGEFKSTWAVTTIEKRAGMTVVTREVQCEDVPGSLVSRVTEQRDAEGRVIRRSKLELVGYGYGRIRRALHHRR